MLLTLAFITAIAGIALIALARYDNSPTKTEEQRTENKDRAKEAIYNPKEFRKPRY